MPGRSNRNLSRLFGLLISVASLTGSLLFFFQSRTDRMQTGRMEKIGAKRESDFRHEYALERLQDQLASHDLWSTFFTAFVRSSRIVRPDEFRQFVSSSNVFTRDPAVRFVGLLGAVDSSAYALPIKGFAMPDLNRLATMPNGTTFIDTDEATLLVRSFPLPAELLQRVEARGGGKGLQLVLLVDVTSLLQVFSEAVPGLVQITLRMGSEQLPDRDQWAQQEFAFAKAGKSTASSFTQEITQSGLIWEMVWQVQADKKSALPAPTLQELAGLGLAIASFMVLLRLSWVRRRTSSTMEQIQHDLMQVPVPVWRVDAHGFVVDMNQPALAHIRRNRAEIAGLVRLRDLTHGPFVPLVGASLGLGPGEMIALGPLPSAHAAPMPTTAAFAGMGATNANQTMPQPVASVETSFNTPKPVPAPAPAPDPVLAPTAPAPTPAPAPAPIVRSIPIAVETVPPVQKVTLTMTENPFRKPAPVYTATDGFDLKVFKSLTGSDLEVMDEARRLSLSSLPQQFQSLCEIVATGDARRIMISAHTLKGNLALLGSKAAMEICLRIEKNELENVALGVWLERLRPLMEKILQELQVADFGEGKPPVNDNPFKRDRAS